MPRRRSRGRGSGSVADPEPSVGTITTPQRSDLGLRVTSRVQHPELPNDAQEKDLSIGITSKSSMSIFHEIGELRPLEPNEILLRLCELQVSLEEILECTDLEPVSLLKFLKTLSRAFISRIQQPKNFCLMEKLLASKLFTIHVSALLHSTLAETHVVEIYCHLLAIFGVYLKMMPLAAATKLSDCVDLCIRMTSIQRWEKNPVPEVVKKAMSNIQHSMQNVLELTRRKESEKIPASKEEASGEVEAPSNFRQMSVLPNVKEITGNVRPCLPTNIAGGKYQSVHHYLDIHFHLHREAYIAALRQAMHKHVSESFDSSYRIFIFSGVKIEKPVYKTDGIIYELSFTTSTSKKVGLPKPHKVIPGSLLCLSADNFQTVLYATVSQYVTNHLNQGTLLVKFEDECKEGLKLIEAERSLLYEVVQLNTNFKVYRNVLEGLQLVNCEKMPLKEYIVHGQHHLVPPHYVDQGTTFDISYVLTINTNQPIKKSTSQVKQMKDHPPKLRGVAFGSSEYSKGSQVCLLDSCKWPSSDKLSLDPSQGRALHFALTSSLAVIQGLTGTGKTYLAHKIVNILLTNRNVWRTPTEAAHLLLIFSTTQALDQFLTEITSSTKKLVRIAGRSKKDGLNRYNLRNFVQENNISIVEELREELRHIKGKIEEQRAKFQLLDYNILNESQLQELTDADGQLVSSLTNDFYEKFGVKPSSETACPKSFLAAWLGLTFENFVSEEEVDDFYHCENDLQDVDDSEQAKAKAPKEAALLAHSLEDGSKNDAIETDDDDSETDSLLLDQVGANIDSCPVPINRDSWAAYIQSLCNPFEHFPAEKTLDAAIIPKYLTLGHVIRVIAEREVKKTQELDDNHVRSIKNVWLMPLSDRWCLYRRWVTLYRAARMNELSILQVGYESVARRLTDITKAEELSVLQESDIICTTITGATLFRELLQETNSKIAIVQEAESIPESHLVSVLSPRTELLILIGDLEQYWLKVAEENLGKDYNTSVSLFERLIKNNILRHETLEFQHRMCPEIASLLITPKYSELNSDVSVQKYANIEGLSTNVFFVNHDITYTDSVTATVTHATQFEADFLLGLCTYLLQQGYEAQTITIVTLCARQVPILVNGLRKENLYGVRVVAIKDFKGEESDIILLTIGSYKLDKVASFLKDANLLRMAISRALKGLYCCGNFGQLSKNSQFYQQLTANLERSKSIGEKLELKCRKHPKCLRFVACGDDFRRLSPRGGCLQICSEMQPCGHQCHQVCHLDGHSTCTDVMKVFPICQHSMLLPCSQDISKVKCVTQVERILKKCGHKVSLECHVDVSVYKCTVKVSHVFPQCQHHTEIKCAINPEATVCEEDCDYRLDCGHRCPRTCHPVEDLNHVLVLCTKPCQQKICEREHRCKMRCCEPCNVCYVIVEKELLCGHTVKVFCHQDVQTIEVDCYNSCKLSLGCGHPCQRLCREPCGKCEAIIEKRLPKCGHTAKLPCVMDTSHVECAQPCNVMLSCGHRCTNKCGELCTKQCNQLVSYTIKSCGHESTVPCHAQHTSKTTDTVCQALCGRLLPCEHQCKGQCSECLQGRVHVPCRESCGHILICGHNCETPCAQSCMPCKRTCQNRCVHSRCQKKCGQPCKPCWEACPWQCPHFKCDKYCNEFCTRPRCDKLCDRFLHCGHPCIGLCGEICPTLCRICNKDELKEFILYGNEEEEHSRFIQLEDCGHCIEVDAMDHWMDMDEGEIQMKGCPRCKTTIWRSLRYGNVIRRRILDVQKVKKELFGSSSKLRDTVHRLQAMFAAKGFIRVDFPDEFLQLHHRLTQQSPLHQNELVVIENQINILELMTKMKEKTKSMMIKAKNNFLTDVKLLGRRLMQNEERITEYELSQINCEIRRLFLTAAATDTENRLARQTNVRCAAHLARVKQILNRSSALTDTKEKDIEVALEAALQLRGGLGISDQERVEIVTAMKFRPGQWYKCPNGHIYAISNCGRAMQVKKCNECGARIGGRRHTLLADNARAREMDGRQQAGGSKNA